MKWPKELGPPFSIGRPKMSETDLQKAQKAFAIQDIYLREAAVWANRNHDPGAQIPGPIAQFKISPTNDVEVHELQPPVGGIRFLVRYFVGTGLRILNPDADPANLNLTRDDLIADIEATFVVRYAVVTQEQPTETMLSAFNDNAVHHVWPYWREFLQATTMRLRVPPIVLPMRVVAPNSAPEQKALEPPK
jgi:hypothetical protein